MAGLAGLHFLTPFRCLSLGGLLCAGKRKKKLPSLVLAMDTEDLKKNIFCKKSFCRIFLQKNIFAKNIFAKTFSPPLPRGKDVVASSKNNFANHHCQGGAGGES